MTVTPISLPLALQTFEIRPTPSTLPVGQKLDELMIDWGDVPAGSSASIYLPAVNADDVIAASSSMRQPPVLARRCAHPGLRGGRDIVSTDSEGLRAELCRSPRDRAADGNQARADLQR